MGGGGGGGGKTNVLRVNSYHIRYECKDEKCITPSRNKPSRIIIIFSSLSLMEATGEGYGVIAKGTECDAGV